MRTRVGETLRRKWRLDSLLGVGGMATVYAATHRNGSRAAVKVLHAAMSIHPVTRARFLREGYVANAVGHPGAVRILDDDVAEDGSLYLVTELLEGETLSHRALRRGGRLQEDEVLAIADQVLDVLTAAHGRGIIHRDIKPDNLFLTRTGQLKVLDFGIAHLRHLPERSLVTKTGALIGTPGFMSPEQGRGAIGELDARTDLWAVGATMFQLLSGKPVHAAESRYGQLLSASTTPAPPFCKVWPESRASVAAIIDRALQFDKTHRWPDSARMQDAVRASYYEGREAGARASRLEAPRETPEDRTRPIANQTLGLNLPAEAGFESDERTAGRAPSAMAPSRGRRLALATVALAAVCALGAAMPRLQRLYAATGSVIGRAFAVPPAARTSARESSAAVHPGGEFATPEPSGEVSLQGAAPPTTPSAKAFSGPPARAESRGVSGQSNRSPINSGRSGRPPCLQLDDMGLDPGGRPKYVCFGAAAAQTASPQDVDARSNSAHSARVVPPH